jgi:FlaG/FlaF family flagellin (archaellin)
MNSMNFERIKSGIRSDRRGVSEIIGNILILMITVILFSTIVAYVGTIPVPETTKKADFAATVSFETAGTTTAALTITHAGGVVLEAARTAVFIQAGTTTQYYKLSEDVDFPYSKWSTGSDWTKSFIVPSESTEIIVMVIDLDKSSAVWTSQVSGGLGGSPPIILQRYVDSNPDSPTADPVKREDTFSFFVKVMDLDNDLNTSTSGVYIDSSSLPDGSPFDTYEESTSDGWFKFDFGEITDVVSLVDGKMIKIHAWDDAGHETVSSYVLSVTVLPSDTVYTEALYDVEGGIPRWITYKSDGQGWGMYHQNLTSGLANVNDPDNTFNKDVDEVVFIRAASTRVHDLMGTNDLVIRDTRTNTVYVPEFNASSTADDPFYVYTALAGATIYECQFKTSSLPPGAYDVAFILQGSGAASATFKDNGPMYLTQADSPITFMPRVWLYSDEEYSVDWGSKLTPFDVTTSTTSRVYVRVEVQDAVDAPSPVVEDVRISDMRGDTQLHGTPPSGSMLGPWVADATPVDNQTYMFDIDLRVNNADQWISGTNAYTLKISRFSDDNEGVYSLSCKIYIQSSTAKADFFVGAAGFMTGTSNFVNPAYLYYIQNNNFFTKRTMYDYSNAPSSADNYAASAFALGDLDGDGDMDGLMGQYNSHNLYYIENSLNTYGAWQEASEITRPAGDDTTVDINWITTGDTNGDGDTDFAYSTTNMGSTSGHTVIIYNNTFGATGYVWIPPNANTNGYNSTHDGVRKIVLEDMTNDGRDDLVVLAEGRVWIYDLVEWDSTSPIATLPGWGEPSGNTNILDFDIGDVNGDGYLDVVTVDSTAASTNVKGVRVWYYVENDSPVEKKLVDTAPDVTYGGWTGFVTNTQDDDDGDAALVLAETAAAPDPGKLEIDMPTETLSTDIYQQLQIRAKVTASGGTASEGFYIWYSIDGTWFTPLIFVPASQTSYDYFTRTLPAAVAGHALTIKVTDSLTTSTSADVVIESLHLDYLAVLTGTFGSYSKETVIDTISPAWQCVAIGNINGLPGGSDLGLEIVVAKDGQWMTYNRTGASPFESWAAESGWAKTDSTFYARGDTKIDLHSSMASDENPIKALMTYSSPRLFKVVDVNGDGYDDVIVVNSTIATAITSQVGLHLNMHGCSECVWLFYVVKDIAADYNIPDVRGGMTWLEVANLMP